jgi:tetratricopeptide (TPR) repeat protein
MRKSNLPNQDIINNLIKLFNKNEFLQVEKEIIHLLSIYPNSDDLFNILGVVYKLTGRNDDSGNCFSKAYKLNPKNINVINNLSLFYHGQGKHKESIILLNDSLKDNRNSFQLYNNLGLAYVGLENYKEGIDHFKIAIKLNNNFFDAHINLGITYKQNKQFNESIQSYNKAISLNNLSAHAFNSRGSVYFILGDYERALDDYETSKSLDSNFSEVYFNLASLFLKKNDIEKAEANIILCLNINPNFPKANLNLGIIYRLRGKNKLALESCKKEILFYEKDHDALFNIAEIYQLSGESELSKEFFYSALKYCPDDNKYNLKLALIEEMDGNFSKAAKLYEKSITEGWEEKSLNCLYSNLVKHGGEREFNNFYIKLNSALESLKGSRIISSICCHDEINFGKNYNYNFCNKPFDFIYKNNILSELKSNKINDLIKVIDDVTMDEINQTLLYNGQQSSGDLFLLKNPVVTQLQEIINRQIINYYEIYKNVSCNFINDWPKKIRIKGWYVSMSNQGFLKRHIHPEGWLSGSLYLQISDELKDNEGNIEFSLHGDNYPINDKAHKPIKRFNVSVGDIILFPSSLFHKTIPFKSEDKRICIAFDLQP